VAHATRLNGASAEIRGIGTLDFMASSMARHAGRSGGVARARDIGVYTPGESCVLLRVAAAANRLRNVVWMWVFLVLRVARRATDGAVRRRRDLLNDVFVARAANGVVSRLR
jgi:hypothetical protein